MLERKQPRALERLPTSQSRAKELARQAARQRTDDAREKLGRAAFETLEAYFPEQAKTRRRRERLRLLMAGIGTGVLLGHLVGRRS